MIAINKVSVFLLNILPDVDLESHHSIHSSADDYFILLVWVLNSNTEVGPDFSRDLQTT